MVFPAMAAGKKSPIPIAANIAVVAKGDAVVGQLKADNERCLECHGIDGQGRGHVDGTGKIVKFAKLAGQNPAYMLKQIQDFRTGVRHDDFMQMMAKSVNDTDMVDILAFFSEQKPMQGDAAEPNAAGRNLYLNGDPAKNVVACSSCHGADAKAAIVVGGANGSGTVPALAGQEWRYLQKQLLDWRSGQRKNNPGGVMNSILKPLSDKEIDGLANYLSALP